MATLLRAAARGGWRRCLQQLVRAPHPGVGCGRAGPPFRPDALPQELDRYALRRAYCGGAERRSRPGRTNPHFRALVCAARGAGQSPADRVCASCETRDAIAGPARPMRPACSPRDRPNASFADGRRALDRVSPRSPADLRHFSSRAVKSARLFRRAARRRPRQLWEAGLLSALSAFCGRPRQDPSVAGGRAYRRSTRALGHLPDRRAIHVRIRRRAAGANFDRVQGAAESDRLVDFRRRPVPPRKVDPGRVRSRAQRSARRRARGDRGRRPSAERS